MANLKYSLIGVRGREMKLYDTKVIITTKVTAGSLLTGNITDGEKTIFLCDVVGVQYKNSSALVGYLQFETPSSQMNNKSDNMFSENTFTFEEGKNGVTNHQMQKVYEYVVDRIEELKYGKVASVVASMPDEQELRRQAEIKLQAEKEYQEKQLRQQQQEEKEQQEKLHKQQRMEAYWAEHAEEKAELEAKRIALPIKIKELYAECKEKQLEKESADSWKAPTPPATAKLQILQREINEMKSQMAELGRFKAKEKEALTKQIEAKEKEIANLKEKIEKEKKEMLERNKRRIQELNDAIPALKAAIADCEKQLAEAENELTKER